jgi:hypothetical protein
LVRQREAKPNPLQKAFQRRQDVRKEREQAAKERELQNKEREAALVRQKKQRERIHKKLTATTPSGQPKLSKHIDVLLSKIQKQQPQPSLKTPAQSTVKHNQQR